MLHPRRPEQQRVRGLSQAEPCGSGRACEDVRPRRPEQQHEHGLSQAEPSGSGRAGEGRHWRWSQRQHKHKHKLGQAEPAGSDRAGRAAAAGAVLGRAWPAHDADDLSSSDEAEPAEPERGLADADQAPEGLERGAPKRRGAAALVKWWADAQRRGLQNAKFIDVVLALHKAARLSDAREAKHFAGLAVREMLARQGELASMSVERLIALLKGPRIGGDKLYLTDLIRGMQSLLVERMHEFAEGELVALMQALRRQVSAMRLDSLPLETHLHT